MAIKAFNCVIAVGQFRLKFLPIYLVSKLVAIEHILGIVGIVFE